MRVRDLMSRDVLAIGVSQSCREAVARMCQGNVRHLPVVDTAGALVGVITDRDLRHHLFSPGIYGRVGRAPVEVLLKGVSVGDVMSSPVVSIGPGCEVAEAARLMREKKIGALPVVDAGRVVGILTEIDLLRHIVRVEAPLSPEMDIAVSYP